VNTIKSIVVAPTRLGMDGQVSTWAHRAMSALHRNRIEVVILPPLSSEGLSVNGGCAYGEVQADPSGQLDRAAGLVLGSWGLVVVNSESDIHHGGSSVKGVLGGVATAIMGRVAERRADSGPGLFVAYELPVWRGDVGPGHPDISKDTLATWGVKALAGRFWQLPQLLNERRGATT
jgi:hypothetical protein